MNVRALSLCVSAALAIAGCGGSSSKKSTTATAPATPTPAPAPAPTTAAPPQRAKPKVTVPKGAPPKQLAVKDLIKGTGAVAKPGSQVVVHYVGVDYKTGKQFDASWDRGQPFPFQLGGGQVIPGWDRGVAGMRVGGRRELIIPPALAYGTHGQPPDIAPNATLVFVIDLIAAQ